MCTGGATKAPYEPHSCTRTPPFLARNCGRNPTGTPLPIHIRTPFLYPFLDMFCTGTPPLVLSSAINLAVVVEDAGPALLGDRQCLLVRLVHLIVRKKPLNEQVLQAGKLAGVAVHGSGAATRQLQQRSSCATKSGVEVMGRASNPLAA